MISGTHKKGNPLALKGFHEGKVSLLCSFLYILDAAAFT